MSRYCKTAVNKAIQSSNRSGRRIGANEAKLIHRLLQGRTKTAGQLAYEADLVARPFYEDGAPRRSWHDLPDHAQWSWERNPTPRH
jgi:hypothetical protein